ncbi:hypothetical protein V6N13_129566 [Hibiscus sabdariffa]|uniref:Uncharacterized protein n=1 Tax=Hibiscus sabdariffa TaxID=183260 RepID=A0ABR2SLU5_9ROSI
MVSYFALSQAADGIAYVQPEPNFASFLNYQWFDSIHLTAVESETLTAMALLAWAFGLLICICLWEPRQNLPNLGCLKLVQLGCCS